MFRIIPLALIFVFSLSLTSCEAQVEGKASQTPTTIKRITNVDATNIAAMALQKLMDVDDISKYGTASGSENYNQPDEYISINFQIAGAPKFLAHTKIDGTLLYLQKLLAAEPVKTPSLNEDSAAKVAFDFVTNRFTFKKDRFQATKVEQEKVKKGVDAYWIVTLDNTSPSPGPSKVPKTLIIKLHPKTQEVMVIEFKY